MQTGFYAGYVASAFTFGRFVSSYPLGKVADSVGRKPVMIAGLLSIMVFSMAFGLSPTFGFAITTRFVLGLTNGIALALRTTMHEVCGQEHVLQGMTYLSSGKAVSIVLGTGIGGLLAQPVLNYPNIFSGAGVLGKYPFLLPNLMGSFGALLLLPLVIMYVPETKDFGRSPAGGKICSGGYVMNGKKEPGVWGSDGLLAIPHVKMILFLICVVQALLIGFEEVYPLWTLSTPNAGGLGWGPVEIGKVFLSAGLIGAVSQLAMFPRVVKILGITNWQRIGCLLAVPAFIVVPCSKALSWNDRSLFLVSVASTALVYCCMAMVNLSLAVASTSMVRSNVRGKMAGLFNMIESLGRFLGPAGSATMFAWSISPSSYDWVDHRFVFFLAAVSMALVAVLAWGTITHENMMAP
ncbi:unnamed protein product, partial [Laminaria digitata]